MEKRTFEKIARDYWSNISHLREYSQALLPHVSQDDEIKKNEIKTIINDLMINLGIKDIIKDEDDTDFTFDLVPLSETSASRDDDLSLETRQKIQEHFETLGKETVTKQVLAFSKKINKISLPKSNTDFLLRSALVSLVGFFEVLISELLHLYYSIVPKALSGEDKIISFNELIKFKTIEEAVEQILFQKIDGFLRGSTLDWNSFFDKRLKIDLSANKELWSDFIENFQRRHVIVHNNGKANAQYFSKVEKDWFVRRKVKISINEPLIIDSLYFNSSLNCFTILGMRLIYEASIKLLPKDTEVMNSTLISIIYDNLLLENWQTTESLCKVALDTGAYTESDRLLYLINYWLSIKRQNRWSEVSEAVFNFDIDACNPRYSLCILSLREDQESFYRLLPIAIRSGVKKEELLNWPVLLEMRSTSNYELQINELV